MKLNFGATASLEAISADLEYIQSDIVEGSVEPVLDGAEENLPLMAMMNNKMAEDGIFITKSYDDTTKSQQIQIYMLSTENPSTPIMGTRLIAELCNCNANDTVDIIMNMSDLGLLGDKISGLGLVSAIRSCKAKVVTHASYLSGPFPVLAWLAGNEIKVGSATLLKIRQVQAGSAGVIADMVDTTEHIAKMNKMIFCEMIRCGLLTKDEVINIVKFRRELTLFGPALEARVKTINAKRTEMPVAPIKASTEAVGKVGKMVKSVFKTGSKVSKATSKNPLVKSKIPKYVGIGLAGGSAIAGTAVAANQ